MIENPQLEIEHMPLNCWLLMNQKVLQGIRCNPINRKTSGQLFEHSAIDRLPSKRQHCTGNTAELHFALSRFLPSFSHLCHCIQACPSICSITRLWFFSLFCRQVICKEK